MVDTREFIVRHRNNPVLERDTIAGYDSLFNPGGIRYKDRLILVVRAARHDRWLAGITPRAKIYTGQICDHLLFESTDEGETWQFTGRKITGSAANWLDGHTGELAVPTYFGPYGTEDVRLCQVGDQIVGVCHVMTHEPYRGDHKAGGRIGLILTEDFRHFSRYVVGPGREETDRDAFIVKTGRKIAFIHRIKPDAAERRKIKAPSIQVAFFDSLDDLIHASPAYWEDHLQSIHEHEILAPAQGLEWEEHQVGANSLLAYGDRWLMFYHGVSRRRNYPDGPARDYAAGVALLDKDFKTIARLPDPLLAPTEWYEVGTRGEDVKRVIFPGPAIRLKNDPKRVSLYYGAADTHIARADIPDIDELVEAILRSPIKGVAG